jgi:hypothetical protein
LRSDSRGGLDDYLNYFVLEPKDHIEYLERVGPRSLFNLDEY